MRKRSDVLQAEHPQRGTLYAAVDPQIHHTEAKVCERRFPAFLAPYLDEASARAALEAAGGEHIQWSSR